jgi:hypothetical protein
MPASNYWAEIITWTAIQPKGLKCPCLVSEVRAKVVYWEQVLNQFFKLDDIEY